MCVCPLSPVGEGEGLYSYSSLIIPDQMFVIGKNVGRLRLNIYNQNNWVFYYRQ